MEYELAAHGLANMKKKMTRKHLKEMHIKELHDGSYHHTAHDGKGGMKEGSAKDLDEAHDALEAHMGAEHPNDGEEMPPEEQAAPPQQEAMV